MQTKASYQDTATEREMKNKALALEAAAEGIVLLENDGILPLRPGKLALFGAGAAYTIQGGSGSGEVNARHTVSVLEGLESSGFTVTTKDWIQRYDVEWRAGKEAFLRINRKKLYRFNTKILADLMAAEYRYPSGAQISEEEILESGANTCVYVLSRQSGEGQDRRDEEGDYRLTAIEENNIRLCAERYKQFILVINTGAPIDLSPVDNIPGINALVYMNQLGMEGGNALAAVLTGKRSPCGKLAVTWAKHYMDYPYGDEFGPYAKDSKHALYKEGIYVGYRYFDSFLVEPRYPFGYGKGYSEFQIETDDVAIDGTDVLLRVRVTNIGKNYAGKEIAQLYVSCPQEGQAKEYQRLTAFGKTKLLAPSEGETLTLRFPLSALASFDEKTAEIYLEAGNFILRVGPSSRDTTPVARLSLSQRVNLSRHRHLCAATGVIRELDENRIRERKEDIPAGLPELAIDPDSFTTAEYDDAPRQECFSAQTEGHLNAFSAEDMVKFCAGTGLFGEKKGFRTPGAVGHTTTDYLDRGIPNAELCDGPAGLRLQRRSTIDKKGNIKAVDTPISLYEFLPAFARKLLLGHPEKEQMLYQFVTGFPVAAAVAQSWNTDLALEIGRAVSAEMKEYGVTWWLAPALNIVRNPLCGRNFEYYSEDPLLSGKFAAAITRGVQETSGNYVTVKHFAANNQEENRYYVSSDLDERTLREIYLRGFEIVVREARPKAVMSAYNKINGTYCANSKDLCTDILRGEWGFDGIVMTDWLSTGKDRADEAECLKSGVDLIMPGGKGTAKALLTAHKEGRLQINCLRQSCGRVLEQILNHALVSQNQKERV